MREASGWVGSGVASAHSRARAAKECICANMAWCGGGTVGIVDGWGAGMDVERWGVICCDASSIPIAVAMVGGLLLRVGQKSCGVVGGDVAICIKSSPRPRGEALVKGEISTTRLRAEGEGVVEVEVVVCCAVCRPRWSRGREV